MCHLRGLAIVVSASMPSSLRASYMLCDLVGSSDPFDALLVSIFFFGALFWSRLARPELAPSLFFSRIDDGFCAGRGPPPTLVWGAGGGPPPAFWSWTTS